MEVWSKVELGGRVRERVGKGDGVQGKVRVSEWDGKQGYVWEKVMRSFTFQ